MPVAIPQNAAYVRISLSYQGDQTYFNNVQVEYGQESTSYQEYGYKLKECYIPKEDASGKQQILLNLADS